MATRGRLFWFDVPLVLVLLLGAGVAHADPSQSDIATAKRLFSEATALRAEGKWEEAVTKLEAAISIKETVGLRFHVAYCEAKLGRLLAAKTDYDRADQMIRDGASAPDVTPLLARARADLVERIPSVRLKVDRTVPGVSVAVDGAQVDSDLGTPLSLDPGTHSIAAHAAAHEPFELSLTLAEGDDRVVDLLLRPSPPPPTQKPVPITRARPRNAAGHTESTGIGPREAVLVTEAALTLAGAALGVTYLLKRGSATERHDATARELPDDQDSCANPTGTAAVTCARLRDSLEERRDDGLIATWGFVGGGVSAAAFVATWLLWPSGASRGTSGGAQLTPSPRGFVLSGHF